MTGDPNTVALDTTVFIYAFERHPSFGGIAQSYLSRIEAGGLRGIVSVIVFTEVLPVYFARNDAAGARRLELLLVSIPNLTVVDVSRAISVEAARLRSAYNLRTPDALHVATALKSGAGCFVSNDRRLERLSAEGIRIEFAK